MRRPDIRTLALAAAVVLAGVAALGPSMRGERPVYDVVAVVDITGSMNARDYAADDGAPESRLAAVKRRLAVAAGRLPCGSRMGLGVFTERRVFLLFEPMEVCANHTAFAGAVAALDWRMAWEGDSRIASGLFRAIDLLRPMAADLVFFTDGQEAPPLRADIPLSFEGKRGEVRGLLVGVGGDQLAPIPKHDDFGREAGFFAMTDVPQESRIGPPPAGAEARADYNARNAPFGDMPPGDEHLTSVHDDHLRALGGLTGFGYARMGAPDDLAAAIAANARPRRVDLDVDLSFLPAAAAFLALAGLYGAPSLARLRRPRRRAPLASGVVTHMRHRFALAAAAAACLTPAFAHGPTPQKVEEKVTITAEPAKVWAVLKDYGGLSAWHPGVAKSSATGSEQGAERAVTLKSGGEIKEGLDEIDPARMTYGYRLSGEAGDALPVSSYSASLTVAPKDGGSEVVWQGRFYRADTSNEPPEGKDDASAVAAMKAFFRTGLDGLKAKTGVGG